MEYEKNVLANTSPVQSVDSVEAREAAQAAEDQKNRDYGQNQPSVERWWVWELFAWFICVAALLGMVGFLAPTNQKPVPKWVLSQEFNGRTYGFSVSINSILSIFSTIVKSALLIPVAASISQLKWLWFSDGHKLSDFQLFDAAKGGPLGSMMILWSMKGRNLVCLGAIITIGSLALDFSFQQLVTYPPTPVRVDPAYMPATATYSNYLAIPPSNSAMSADLGPDSKMTSALKIAVNAVDTTVDIVPDCRTGNCTWPAAYASIAVCSECLDASPKIVESCGTYGEGDTATPYCNYSYPGENSLGAGLKISGMFDSTTTLRTIFAASSDIYSENSLFFKDMKSPLAILQTLGTTQGNSNAVTPHGVECALFYCVKKYSGSVNQTVFQETLLDTYRNDNATYTPATTTDDGQTTPRGDYQITAPEEFMKGTSHNGSLQFAVTANASVAMEYYFFTLQSIAGKITQNPTFNAFVPTNWMAYIWPLDTDGYSQAMSYIAGNATNAIRMASLASPPNLKEAGTVWQDQPKVNVIWYWIIVPGVLIVLSFLFLILTMVESARRGAILWKSSPLAAFYHPLTKEGREKLTKASGPRQLEEIAADITVKAERTEKGPRLVQPSQ